MTWEVCEILIFVCSRVRIQMWTLSFCLTIVTVFAEFPGVMSSLCAYIRIEAFQEPEPPLIFLTLGLYCFCQSKLLTTKTDITDNTLFMVQEVKDLFSFSGQYFAKSSHSVTAAQRRPRPPRLRRPSASKSSSIVDVVLCCREVSFFFYQYNVVMLL